RARVRGDGRRDGRRAVGPSSRVRRQSRGLRHRGLTLTTSATPGTVVVAMAHNRRTAWGREPGRRARATGADARRPSALAGLVEPGDNVLVLGLEELGDAAWTELAVSGLGVLRLAATTEALRTMAEGAAQVVVTGVRQASTLTSAVRARPELAA